MTIHPIEVESYRIMRGRIDLSAWSSEARAVVERMVHATADESYVASARIGDDAITLACRALADNGPIIVDAAMVAAGITRRATKCFLTEVPVAPEGSTRSAAAIKLAAGQHPSGAVWVIGNAPTALMELLDLYAAGAVDPAAVIGVPVGFVGAAEAKAALWRSELAPRAITNVGERGGSPVAAAVVNALVRIVERTDAC
jgi:precorrin-8X/cobalt-precorrin-8 methylmutase